MADYAMEELAYEINVASAQIAKQAALEVSALHPTNLALLPVY